jgi:hypothetical protein
MLLKGECQMAKNADAELQDEIDSLQDSVDSARDLLDEVNDVTSSREDLAQAVVDALDALSPEEEDEDQD